MKTKIVWSLVILMTLSTIARAQVHPMDKKNEKSIWHRLNTTLSNDALLKTKQNSSKLNSTVTSYWNGEVMEVVAKNELTYTNDLISINEGFLKTDSVWVKDWKTEYIYNNGLISTITNLSYDFGTEAYVPVDQSKFVFQLVNNVPQLQTELYRGWIVGTGWVSTDKYDYQYENGLLSGGIESVWGSSAWVEVEKFTTTSLNDTTYITYFEFVTENWNEYSRELYPNLTLSELYDYYTEFVNAVDIQITFSSLEFPDYIYQEKIDDIWVNIDAQKTSDYYDIFDGTLKMRELKYLNWNEDWVVSYNREIWYNSKTNPDSATVNVFFETGKVAAGQEIYNYNDASQLSKVDFLQNIGEGLALQSSTVLNWDLITSNEPKSEITSFRLNPAYPNPFNPTTNISFSLEKTSQVRINIYDMLGRHITTLVNSIQPSGNNQVVFDASKLSSGIYIVRMEANEFNKTQKITLVK